jgi:hypothetical protein
MTLFHKCDQPRMTIWCAGMGSPSCIIFRVQVKWMERTPNDGMLQWIDKIAQISRICSTDSPMGTETAGWHGEKDRDSTIV